MKGRETEEQHEQHPAKRFRKEAAPETIEFESRQSVKQHRYHPQHDDFGAEQADGRSLQQRCQ